MGALDIIKGLDLTNYWNRLSPADQKEIGAHAIRRALFDYAAAEFEAGVVYLDADGRWDADQLSFKQGHATSLILWRAFPDLFGHDPEPSFPDGTDPWWAEPLDGETGKPIPAIRWEAARAA